MPRASAIWTNWTAGEASPLIAGRPDLEKYYNTARRVENFICQPHGGVITRPGTRFIAEARGGDGTVRLLPFAFNVDQAYILELGEDAAGSGYIRFFTDQGGVLGAVDPNLVTDGEFSTSTGWTYDPTYWAVGNGSAVCDASHVAFGSVLRANLGWELQEGQTYRVQVHLQDYVGTPLGGGLIPILGGVSATGVSMQGDGTHTKFIQAGAGTALGLRGEEWFKAKLTSVSVKSYEHYRVASPWTADQILDLKFCQSADVMYLCHPLVPPQKLSRYGHADWTLEPVNFIGTPSTVITPGPGTVTVMDWGTDNWPGAVMFHEQRAWWAATPDRPQTLWASVSGDAEDMTLSTGAEDPDGGMKYTIAADQVNPIFWMVPQETLVIGTWGSIWSVGARSSLDAITPDTVFVVRTSTYGASKLQGLQIAGSIIFMGRDHQQVLEMAYRLESDGLDTQPINILSEHITRSPGRAYGGVSAMSWAQNPHGVIWLVRGDGMIATGTFHPGQDVMAWARTITNGSFESLAVIPGQYRDEVWVVVKRRIQQQDHRYIEMFESVYGAEPGNLDIEDAFQVDCGLTYAGSATTLVTGAEHLAGEMVNVLTDGAVHPQVEVSDAGTVNLDWPANKVILGLPYRCLLETQNLEAGAADGTAQGKKKRIHSVVLRFFNTVGAKVGVDEQTLQELDFRQVEHEMDAAIPGFEGDIIHRPDSGFASHGRLVVVQDDPLPMNLLALMPQVTTNDQ